MLPMFTPTAIRAGSSPAGGRLVAHWPAGGRLVAHWPAGGRLVTHWPAGRRLVTHWPAAGCWLPGRLPDRVVFFHDAAATFKLDSVEGTGEGAEAVTVIGADQAEIVPPVTLGFA